MSIDPRLVERRKTVAEDNAKRNVSRLLRFLIAVVVAGALVWVAFSPWLSVSQVDTSGIDASPAHEILVDHRVIAGTPMFQIDAAGVEGALLDDPWIAEATVSRHWPNNVTVEIVERTPVAWSRTEVGWTRRAVDGVALPSAAEPDEHMAWVEMAGMSESELAATTDMTGALEFIDALPVERHEGTTVTRIDGELWATVDGFQVRLGRSVDMREKALSLDALLDRDIPTGSVLVLIAPTNPAVSTPAPVGESKDGSSTLDSGDEGAATSEDDVANEAGTDGGQEGDDSGADS